MNLKKSPPSIHDNNQRDPNNANDYPTIADLIIEQNVSCDRKTSVHYRRDLDSLG